MQYWCRQPESSPLLRNARAILRLQGTLVCSSRTHIPSKLFLIRTHNIESASTCQLCCLLLISFRLLRILQVLMIHICKFLLVHPLDPLEQLRLRYRQQLRSAHRRSECPSRSQPLPWRSLSSSAPIGKRSVCRLETAGASRAPARSTVSRGSDAHSTCSSLASMCCPSRRSTTCAPCEWAPMVYQTSSRSNAAGSSGCGRTTAVGSTRRSSSSPTRQPPVFRISAQTSCRCTRVMSVALLAYPDSKFCFTYETLGQRKQHAVSYCVSGE